MTYIDHIKNSFFADGCAPTFKVHLYLICLIAKISWKYVIQEKKVFIYLAIDLLLLVIPDKLNNLKDKITLWKNKYLNYLINKDWRKVDFLYFNDDEKWNEYLKEHPERKEYFEKMHKYNSKLAEIFLDQERVDSNFVSNYIDKYM